MPCELQLDMRRSLLGLGKARKHLAASGLELRQRNSFGLQTGFNNSVKALYLGGLRMREVAAMLSCCVGRVQKRLKWLGVKARNSSQYYSSETVRRHRRVVYWRSRCLSVTAIAKIESMPVSTVYYVLIRNGVKMDGRRRMCRNQLAIARMALLNPERYREYADRKIAAKETKKWKWAARILEPLPDEDLHSQVAKLARCEEQH